MNNVSGPISMTSWYDSEPALPASRNDSVANTPYYHDILIQNVTATNAKGESIHLFGRPESYISNVTFDNVQIKATQGMFLAYCRGIKFINGCNLATTAGNYIKRRYEAYFTGNYDGSDPTTGINAPSVTKTSTDNAWYNLSGQKVNENNMPKGIYIHEGKKFIVK